MKRDKHTKYAKRFYREIKNLVASQSTCDYFGRFLHRFNRRSIAWHTSKHLAEQHKRVDAIQEILAAL